MSKSKKAILTGSFILLIFHIGRYFLYDGDIVQTTLGIVSMIFIILSLIINKEEKK